MKRILWILPLALVTAACKGEQTPSSNYTANPGTSRYSAPAPGQRQPGARSSGMAGAPAVGPTRTGTPRYDPYTPPSVARPMPTPPPMPSRPEAGPLPSSGVFRWASSLREAQDAARASGRLVFIETGRPACGNCQGLRNEVIPNPTVSAELGALVVGYYTDCDAEPNAKAFQLLTSNLPGAATLPLVGFFTPDLRWVHGYSGGRNVSRFRQEIATARAAYQRLASVDRPGTPYETAALPTRSLGSLPDAELADVSRELADDRMLDAGPAPTESPTGRALAVSPTAPVVPTAVTEGPVLAEVAAAERAAAAQSAEVARIAAARGAEVERTVTALAAAREAAVLALEAENAAALERAETARLVAEDRERAALAAALNAVPEPPGTAVVAPSAAPVFAPATPTPVEPAAAAPADVDVRTWAQTELRRAAAALSSGDFASARTILGGVREKAAGAPEAREAAKGDVAIWNLRKIQRAGSTGDADRLRVRAKADLEATVFEALFA